MMEKQGIYALREEEGRYFFLLMIEDWFILFPYHVEYYIMICRIILVLMSHPFTGPIMYFHIPGP